MDGYLSLLGSEYLRGFFGRRVPVYALLVLLFVVKNISTLLLVKNLNSIIFPLESIYIANQLLFPGWAVSPAIAQTLFVPANAGLVYPPGLYLLIKMLSLDSVSRIFLFSFLVQLPVPIGVYELMRKVTDARIAFAFAAFYTLFVTNVAWWSPDHVIQLPLLLALCLLVVSLRSSELRPLALFALGILTGIIVVLKHNEGIFFGIACGAVLILHTLHLSSPEETASRRDAAFTLLMICGSLLLGLAILSRLLYIDEIILYLLPYFLFLGITWFLFKKHRLSLQLRKAAGNLVPYGAGVILIPGVVMLWIILTIPFERYLYTLFGMGFQYLRIWDAGIVGLLKTLVQAPGGFTLTFLFTLVIGALCLFPFATNFLVLPGIFRLKPPSSFSETSRLSLELGALAIFSVFMLFPLESYHIVSTKLFIFFLVFAYFLGSLSPGSLKAVAVLALLAAAAYLVVLLPGLLVLVHPPPPMGQGVLQARIGIPVSEDLGSVLGGQLEAMNRSIGGRPYYLIDGSGGGMSYLKGLVDDGRPQYYIEMREGLLDPAVVDRIIEDLGSVPFVVVRMEDLEASRDPELRKVLDYVRDHFTPVDSYVYSGGPGVSSINVSFTIFEGKPKGA